MQPPVQVVTLVFFCAAALIDLSMVQANRDPPRAAHVCVRKKHRWANRWLPRGAASSLHDVAHEGFDGSADCLCKLQGRTSVRHEVPAYGQYEHNHSSQHKPCRNTIALPSSITSTLSFSKSHARARAPLPSHGPSPPSLATSPFARSKQSLGAWCSYTVPIL
jgi:hypothetical protein